MLIAVNIELILRGFIRLLGRGDALPALPHAVSGGAE
jgi:hypothetical protein